MSSGNPWHWREGYASADAAEERLAKLTELAPRASGFPVIVEVQSAIFPPHTQVALGVLHVDLKGTTPVVPYGVVNNQDGPQVILLKVGTRKSMAMALGQFLARYKEVQQ